MESLIHFVVFVVRNTTGPLSNENDQISVAGMGARVLRGCKQIDILEVILSNGLGEFVRK
jgi:hypothetical protein